MPLKVRTGYLSNTRIRTYMPLWNKYNVPTKVRAGHVKNIRIVIQMSSWDNYNVALMVSASHLSNTCIRTYVSLHSKSKASRTKVRASYVNNT